jgi:hypothetical protein
MLMHAKNCSLADVPDCVRSSGAIRRCLAQESSALAEVLEEVGKEVLGFVLSG